MTAPTIGRIVHYTLTQANAEAINKRRGDFSDYRGNAAHEGDVFPLVITRIWSGDSINGQVLLDGSDNLWVISINNGPDQGQWEWPIVVR